MFGSRARGDHKRASDIDLAVQGGDISRFALDVEEETSTPLKYDVVNLDRTVQEAYAVYPFFDGEVWLDMLRDRNDMAHIYDGNAARELVGRILKGYIPEFVKLEEELNEKYGTTLNTL